MAVPRGAGTCAIGALLVAVLLHGTPVQADVWPDASACSVGVLGSIDDIVNAAYDIAQAAADCTLPGLSELSCTSDLTDMMSYWFNCGNKIATMTLACGSLDNECSANAMQSLGDISSVSNDLTAAASDCVTSPFLCTYDVVTAVDDMNGFIGDILAMLTTCNQGGTVPGPAELGFLLSPQAIGNSRRLSEKAETDHTKVEDLHGEIRALLGQVRQGIAKLRKGGGGGGAEEAAEEADAKPKDIAALKASRKLAQVAEMVQQLKQHLHKLQAAGLAPTERPHGGAAAPLVV